MDRYFVKGLLAIYEYTGDQDRITIEGKVAGLRRW
jgi:hypothetical protein